jgi:hypothetical protein
MQVCPYGLSNDAEGSFGSAKGESMKGPFLFSLLLVAVLWLPSEGQNPGPTGQPETVDRQKAQFIGLRYGGELPLGYEFIGGALISDPYRDEKQYGVTHASKGKVFMLWLERLTHRDEKGRPFWEIRDVLFLPRLAKGQMLFYTNCSVRGKPDAEVMAITDAPPRGRLSGRVRYAWRANRQTEKVEVLPVEGIKCEIEGY